MDREQLEFRICQYVDGVLPTDEAAALEQALAGDVEARGMVGEHRRLLAQMNQVLVMPAVNWDRLAAHLSSVVAEADSASGATIPLAGRSSWVLPWGRLAAAASFVLAASAALLVVRHERHAGGPSVVQTAQPSDVVVVAQPEAPTGKPSVDISIGPSRALAAQGGDWRYADGVVGERSPAVVVSRADSAGGNRAGNSTPGH